MPARNALRAVMLGLVFVNLVFVQLTDGADPIWLVPLYMLTALSPVITRWQGMRGYALVWNCLVLGVFAALVKHASSNDLSYVLQDGLLLAAMCQVHLLNNLGPKQEPDLLFINAFLVASITGYLCEDLAFALTFLLFAPLFVIGLQLLCSIRGEEELTSRATARVALDGLQRAGVLLGLCLGVFLLWPRDFQRSGLLEGRFEFTPSDGKLEIGFNRELKLDRNKDKPGPSSEVVMTITVEQGPAFGAPLLWRGATLLATNGEEWWPAQEREDQAAIQPPWTADGTSLRRGEVHDEVRLSVLQVDPAADALFTPLASTRLTLGAGADPRRLRTSEDGTIAYKVTRSRRPPVPYTLDLPAAQAVQQGGPTPVPQVRELVRFTSLPATRVVRMASGIANAIDPLDAPRGDQHELVERFSRWISSNSEYALPGTDGAARNLKEFLAGRSGHCEFFAAGLATLCRTRDIPARIVTGYRGGEWDDGGRTLTVRRHHAHAWVEVYDPLAGWVSVDPVPASSLDLGPGLWERSKQRMLQAWTRLTNFDAEARGEALAWLQALPGRLAREFREHPRSGILALLGLGLMWLLVHVRRSLGLPAPVRRYGAALRGARLRPQPGETPRELLARARGLDLSEARLQRLEQATEDHERARYAA